MTIASISDYREAARRRLPHFLFEYIDGGSYDEVTLHRNSAALQALAVRQRVMRDVSRIDLSTTLFGQDLAMPVILAPVGLAGLYVRRGECQAIRAAESVGIPFTLSTVSACSLQEVRKASAKPYWFQLYMMRDRSFMETVLEQAQSAGSHILVFTVDMPVPGSRYRDARSGLAGGGMLKLAWQAALRPGWAWDVGLLGRPHTLGSVAPVLHGKKGISDFFAWIGANFDPSISWRDLEWVRERWKGPIVVKGIMEADDAEEALQAGADAVVVSNHGGRQLDGVPATAQALPAVANRVAGRIPVLVDGGIRSGLDVVRMLALGADSVMIGRAWAFALAAAGETGVRHMLELMAAEMRAAMALTGCTSIAQIDRDILVRSDG